MYNYYKYLYSLITWNLAWLLPETERGKEVEEKKRNSRGSHVLIEVTTYRYYNHPDSKRRNLLYLKNTKIIRFLEMA